jgi:hypothetical protein
MKKDTLILIGIILVGGVIGVFFDYNYLAPKPFVAPAPVENQYAITAADNGKTFSYPLTSRFSVFLDSTLYPQKNLTCSPQGIVGSISNIAPAPSPNLYSVRFETVATGTCILQDGAFSATIDSTP